MTRAKTCSTALLGLSMVAYSAVLPAQDAAVFRGSTARVGIYASARRSAPTGVKWRFRTNGAVFSSPTVAAGVVYVGSNDGYLYAVNAGTGSLKWKFKPDRRIPSSPAVVDGVVYFGSYDSNVYAVDTATGKLNMEVRDAG